MSKQSDRRAAEREARKLAYQQRRQGTPQLARALETNEIFVCEQTEGEFENPAEEPTTKATTSAVQIAANRKNAKLSCGPTSIAGRAIVSENRRTHGLTGRFTVLAWENAEDFQSLTESIHAEHNPETDTERRLVDSLIQHYWLKERAVQLQEQLLANSDDPTEVDPKKLGLFLRYQTTHERSYYKADRELQNLKKAKRKEEIGFESQNRQQEAHEARVRLAHAKAMNLEIDTSCRQVMEAPIPGNERLSFEELTHACSVAISTLVYQKQTTSAA